MNIGLCARIKKVLDFQTIRKADLELEGVISLFQMIKQGKKPCPMVWVDMVNTDLNLIRLQIVRNWSANLPQELLENADEI